MSSERSSRGQIRYFLPKENGSRTEHARVSIIFRSIFSRHKTFQNRATWVAVESLAYQIKIGLKFKVAFQAYPDFLNKVEGGERVWSTRLVKRSLKP